MAIIFTEHDEVIMSVSDMRDLIRSSAELGIDMGRSFPEQPATFLTESIRVNKEYQIRGNKK